MRSQKLLNLARPHLEKNDLGVGHTARVLSISRKYFQRPKGKDEFVDAIAILHDVGGPSIKEQYKKGPTIARELMEKLDFSEKEIDEAGDIIKTHHNLIKNPTEEFAILYDSDQLVKLTPEEFSLHEKEGINWENIINSLHHKTAKDLAKEWLFERREKMNFNNNVMEMIEYPKQGILSKVIKKDKLNITLFCMAKGTDISEHTSTKQGIVYVIEGQGIFNLEGKNVEMKKGVLIYMTENAVHSLKADENTSFLLVLTEN